MHRVGTRTTMPNERSGFRSYDRSRASYLYNVQYVAYKVQENRRGRSQVVQLYRYISQIPMECQPSIDYPPRRAKTAGRASKGFYFRRVLNITSEPLGIRIIPI